MATSTPTAIKPIHVIKLYSPIRPVIELPPSLSACPAAPETHDWLLPQGALRDICDNVYFCKQSRARSVCVILARACVARTGTLVQRRQVIVAERVVRTVLVTVPAIASQGVFAPFSRDRLMRI